MLTIITGQPGAGKTLYMLTAVKLEAEKTNRPVYVAGVRGLNLELLPNWIELDDKKDWHKVPDGSIVVIDECQEMWRTRGVGAQVPDYVSAMETHRHRGIDVWATTQHPMLIDSNIRRLVGRHLHVMRVFGMAKATIHEWNVLRAEPDKSRTDSVRHDFVYPSSSYALYKSAEIHTHKRNIPKRVYFLLAVPLLLAGLVYVAYSTLRPYSTGENIRKSTGEASPGAPGSLEHRPAAPKLTTAEYVASYQPRVPGLEFTAPIYDEVTRPTVAPYPAAAVQLGNECRAYTQQGTRLDMPQDLCQDIVARGFFITWEQQDPSKRAKTAQERTE